ncbi:DMT family transporter [Lutibacter maritimus]|uniref:EamA domain-containing membrane protein RarD n=1 Tax=Lutibacter maritimus TaxID=593133 RepID=A0A1I6RGQ1_9FLAO|nr:EamA family transporter [Lutibacter maritimus]SFS63882.1 EamA domain-containing membrane protein RarD [Lutibacter maritimus]
MEQHKQKWIFLIILSLVWGSSFILMKKALISLNPVQVGALRILITAIFLFLIGFKRVFKINKTQWYYLFLNGVIGSFIPVFLFAFAVKHIDSSIASILNSLTPLNTLIFGYLVFGFAYRRKQLLGVLIGLAGTVILILKGAEINPSQNYLYSILVLIATICYAFNLNIIKKHLQDLDALSIAVGNFMILMIPALIILYFTGIFSTFEVDEASTMSLVYITILAVFGTGLAKILYNHLIKISTPVYSSSVTYLIPIVAILWGILDGEKISAVQILAGGIIIFGVYLVNKAK